MIIKAISHKGANLNYRSFIEYLFNQNKQGHSKDQWRIVQNIDCVSSDKDRLEEAFVNNAKLKPRRKGSVALFHILISASPDSGATPEIMYDLTNYYLQIGNKNNGLVVAALHTDKQHLHVHIMQSGNAFGSGKSTSISRKEFYQIREDFERYQIEKYPHIKDIIYLPEYKLDISQNHSRFTSDAEYNIKKRGHNTDKSYLQSLIENAFENAKDRTHFYSLLQSNSDVQIYERRGKPTGLKFNNRKYRFKRLMDEHSLNHKFAILDRLEELSRLQNNPERDGLER